MMEPMRIAVLAAVAAALPPASAQIFTFDREQMIHYTAKNPFDRFADGRPKVPDSLLERVRDLSAEEVWAVLSESGYRNQFEGNWQILHPGKKLVGRAVTAQYMPLRPDAGEVADAVAKAKGQVVSPPQRVIDMLGSGDVVVVDLFGKVKDGTFGGDNLHTAIWAATKTGFVIHGGIRDLDDVVEIPSAGYFRGSTPSSYREVMLTGINVPIRIGGATVMPGDVVFGDREGVSFIPPHLVQKVLDRAEIAKKARLKK
jgi:4-hydroxy-4-methyl-2-oxoglutarate aldolase